MKTNYLALTLAAALSTTVASAQYTQQVLNGGFENAVCNTVGPTYLGNAMVTGWTGVNLGTSPSASTGEVFYTGPYGCHTAFPIGYGPNSGARAILLNLLRNVGSYLEDQRARRSVRIGGGLGTSTWYQLCISTCGYPVAGPLLGINSELEVVLKNSLGSNPDMIIGTIPVPDVNTWTTSTFGFDILTSSFDIVELRMKQLSAYSNYVGRALIDDIKIIKPSGYFMVPCNTVSTMRLGGTSGEEEGINKAISADNDISIAPNPVENMLSITLPENMRNGKVAVLVTNVEGKTVLAQESTNSSLISLDMSTYATGTYFLKVSSNNTVITKKIYKQ